MCLPLKVALRHISYLGKHLSANRISQIWTKEIAVAIPISKSTRIGKTFDFLLQKTGWFFKFRPVLCSRGEALPAISCRRVGLCLAQWKSLTQALRLQLDGLSRATLTLRSRSSPRSTYLPRICKALRHIKVTLHYYCVCVCMGGGGGGGDEWVHMHECVSMAVCIHACACICCMVRWIGMCRSVWACSACASVISGQRFIHLHMCSVYFRCRWVLYI